uniref:2-hydroxyacyl-CoA lyase n=2 Tax=Macrostomum lignano TaxID=282301 RepID=A0A1I8IEV9_9PLAT
MDGATVLAQALRSQGIEYAFGIVGIPVVEVAVAFQSAGIKFVAMRNEQSASYAASAIGYLTGKPGVCLVVSGPGVVHALAGLSNANENCWPVLVIGGASDSHLDGSEAFQEFPQAEAAAKFCKFSARLPSIARIPHFVHKAVKQATYGRPGAVYLDLPGDFVTSSVDSEEIHFPPPLPQPPVTLADPQSVSAAARLLRSARRPLVVIGKGAAQGRAELAVRQLIQSTRLPFLPTPMGKGVAADDHPGCVSAARTRALKQADVVVLLGARLNWILHFGRPPRWTPDVKFIQVDIHPEEFHTNVTCEVALCGSVAAVVEQLSSELHGFEFSSSSDWWRELNAASAANRARVDALIVEGQTVPMTYYSALNELAKFVDNSGDDWLIVSEGANSMDIGRAMLPNRLARRRLDAGTFGTMGVGLGFAAAADLCIGDSRVGHRRVLCLEGDSAVGFSLAELETLARYRMPVLLVVINNSGIYSGVPADVLRQLLQQDGAAPSSGASSASAALRLPATSLTSECRYDLAAEALGGYGRLVRSVGELRQAFAEFAGVRDRPCLINAIIDTGAERKQQEFDWLSRSKL